MRSYAHSPRYNQRNRQMEARATELRLGCLTMFRRTSLRSTLCLMLRPTLSRLSSLLLLAVLLPSLLFAANLDDAARQLADRIAAVSGPGAIALEITNRSSLDEKSVRAVHSAIQAQLRVHGIRTASADQSMGSVSVVLSESLREYVWTAEVAIGTDQPRIVLVSLPRPPSAAASPALPMTLKKTLLFTQEQPILDVALIDMGGGATSGGARLLVLDPTRVATYRQQSGHSGSPADPVLAGWAGRWELETSLPITHSRPFPRDVRGRLLLRRDHLFDAYLPGTFCRSSAAMPLTVNCSASDDPWPLTPEENGVNGTSSVNNATNVRAFYAPARNFFTGVLSPGIGKISNVPSFYSAAAIPRPNYTLWVLAAVDGSIHVVDGITDQAIRGGHFGSDLASVRSNCGVGTQLLVSASGDPERDGLRAYEIPDRDPVPVSSPLEFDGSVTALWPDASLTGAVAIVKREGTGWYEANRISISCAN